MSTEALNASRLANCYPLLVSKANAAIDSLKSDGVTVLITQGLRTFAEQDALYAQGRTTPGKVVTKAPGGRSFHNYGLAFDIVPLDETGKPIWNESHPSWAKCITAFKAQGLEWGGDWTSFKDMPHFQLVAGLQITLALSIYKEKCIAGVWEQVTKRIAQQA